MLLYKAQARGALGAGRLACPGAKPTLDLQSAPTRWHGRCRLSHAPSILQIVEANGLAQTQGGPISIVIGRVEDAPDIGLEQVGRGSACLQVAHRQTGRNVLVPHPSSARNSQLWGRLGRRS